ncbi:MAG: hypothetical protein RSC93_05740 [Erysipelotrichaceae bacterium]
MEKILKLCNKYYNLKYEKSLTYQTLYKELKVLNEKYHLTLYDGNEFDCFKNEILYHSLCNKIAFEECFLKTYVSMHDYWYDLDYKERKHQMNVDIDGMRASLPMFLYQDQCIYLPIFDEKMNRLYLDEMVLFDLKQYGKIRNEFKAYIKIPRYGKALYESKFTSLEFIKEIEDTTWVYARELNRLYCLENDQYKEMFCLNPDKDDASHVQLIKIVELYHENLEIELIDYLIQEMFVDEKVSKKLKKYQHKLIKKAS